jgi:hypothetical protein
MYSMRRNQVRPTVATYATLLLVLSSRHHFIVAVSPRIRSDISLTHSLCAR